jgi:hypothetical protein
MRAVVNAAALAKLLRTMRGRGRSRETFVQVSGAGASLVLLGSHANGTSLEALVHEPGSGYMPVESAVRVLAIYPKRASVVIACEADAFWIDKLRLPIRVPNV